VRHGQRPGQGDERALAGHVRQQVCGGRGPDGVGDHEDDPAEAAGGHAGHEGLGEQQGGLHVDRLHPAPDGQIQAGQVGPVERGRRVDQHVAAAGLVQHPLRRRPDLLLVGEVHGNVARSVQDEDLVARCGQGRRDATADGPGAAGDHRHPADRRGHAPARHAASVPAIRPNTMASVSPPPCSIRCPQTWLTAPAA
jgi:hypothetical protein